MVQRRDNSYSMHSMTFTDDPNRQIDDHLDMWAYWRRRANRIAGGTRNALERLYAEGDEVDKGSTRVDAASRTMRRVNASIRWRIVEHRIHYKQFRDAGDEKHARDEHDAIEDLERILLEQPKTMDQLPLASLIHGQGFRRQRAYPLEEAVELAVRKLNGRYRTVIKRNYLNPLPQDINAKQMHVSLRTFQYWLAYAKRTLTVELGL